MGIYLGQESDLDPYAPKRLYGAIDVGGRVCRRELDADARFAFGHDRIEETNDVESLAEELGGHALCERRVTEHDGNDGMNALFRFESSLRNLGTKRARVIH